jgi:hypothetical protein
MQTIRSSSRWQEVVRELYVLAAVAAAPAVPAPELCHLSLPCFHADAVVVCFRAAFPCIVLFSQLESLVNRDVSYYSVSCKNIINIDKTVREGRRKRDGKMVVCTEILANSCFRASLSLVQLEWIIKRANQNKNKK